MWMRFIESMSPFKQDKRKMTEIREQLERLRSNQVFLFPWRYEAADTMEKMLVALTEIAECKGLTLLGCNCDNYMHCDCGDTAYRAHERGANKAFEQCASTAKTALVSTEREPK